MKIIFNLLLFSLGIILLSSSSCNKKDDCEHPNLTEADISGSVLLFDDFQDSMDKSGMVVTVLNTNPPLVDTTNSSGNYSFSSVVFGNYTLQFEKDGYGTFLVTIAHVNECKLVTEVPTYYLGKTSTTTITSLSAETIAAHVEIDITINPSGTTEQPRYFRLFFKNLNDVSKSSYDEESGLLFTNTNASSINLSIGELHGLGYLSGETVYAKAYGDSYYSNEYFDASAFFPHTVFPNANIVTVQDVSFIVP
jgi:hypothetical protein